VLPFRAFAYGSLVGVRTRPSSFLATPATLGGWVREWSHGIKTKRGKVCALSVSRAEGSGIQGILLEGDEDGERELDQREEGYLKESVSVLCARTNGGPEARNAVVYVGDDELRIKKVGDYPIWLSYLLVVLAGYRELGGWVALEEFFRTTRGWNTPILDDSANPKYSRAIQLKRDEEGEIQQFLGERGLLANAIRE